MAARRFLAVVFAALWVYGFVLAFSPVGVHVPGGSVNCGPGGGSLSDEAVTRHAQTTCAVARRDRLRALDAVWGISIVSLAALVITWPEHSSEPPPRSWATLDPPTE